jgi:hypothetical protein
LDSEQNGPRRLKAISYEDYIQTELQIVWR